VVDLHVTQEPPQDPVGFTSVKKASLQGHQGPIRGVAFHPKGKHLVTVSTDGTARLWSVPGGEQVRTWDWGPDKLSAVAFAPDGLAIAAGRANGQVAIRDIDG
jgi:WD40 repeat protein